MRIGLLSLFLVLGLSLFSNADTIQEKNWNKMLDIVEHTGKILESPYGDYLFVESINPEDTTQSHLANYFSLVGGMGTDGKFHYTRIEVVSENWQLGADGNWHIDQYLFRISPEQKILTGSQVDMVQTKSRSVIKYESRALTDAEMKSHWERIRNQWYAEIGLD